MTKSFSNPSFQLGILGGGQLGRMFIQKATDFNVHVAILDPSENAPCRHLAHSFTKGDFNDYETVLAFGRGKDVLTIEIEHVNTAALKQLVKEGVKVFPQPEVIELIQDKGLQKQFYQKHDIPTAPFTLHNSADEAKDHALPFVQKMRKGGYDGKGVQVIKTADDLAQLFDVPNLVEEAVNIEKELSVIVARNADGQVESFPLVELEYNPVANLVEYLFSPASVSPEVEEQAQIIARNVVSKLNLVGILAVEMFLDKEGNILVNEVAPRTHNSGHQSIEGNYTSQFEQHLRAILNLPLGNTGIIIPSVMVNLLGEPGHTGPADYQGMSEIIAERGVYPHLYGKADTKPYRKMGHITVIDPDLAKAKSKAKWVKETIKVVAKN